jgi:hypothetical protein
MWGLEAFYKTYMGNRPEFYQRLALGKAGLFDSSISKS